MQGNWKVENLGVSFAIFPRDGQIEIARVFNNRGEGKATADLITTAVNACIYLNPENPMAVASSIEAMYNHLEVVGEQLDNIKNSHDLDYTIRTAIKKLLGIVKAKGK